MESVHSNGIEEIHDVPMAVITRPIPPVLDENKVKSLMETISVCDFVNVFVKNAVIKLSIHHFR